MDLHQCGRSWLPNKRNSIAWSRVQITMRKAELRLPANGTQARQAFTAKETKHESCSKDRFRESSASIERRNEMSLLVEAQVEVDAELAESPEEELDESDVPTRPLSRMSTRSKSFSEAGLNMHRIVRPPVCTIAQSCLTTLLQVPGVYIGDYGASQQYPLRASCSTFSHARCS